MKYKGVIFIISSGVLLCACDMSPGVDLEAERASLRQADADYSEAAAAKDIERWASWYVADATMYPPNGSAVTGIDAIQEFGVEFSGMPDFAASFDPVKVEVSVDGDMGYTLNDYVITITGPDGNPVTEQGPDFHVWRKQADGSWKIVIDIWNSENPMPSAATSAAPLEGAWVVTSLQSSEGEAIDPAGPGQFIFLDGRYSAVYTVGVTERRKSEKAFDPTEEEMVEQYDTIIVNSGTYQVEGNELTLRPLVAKSPEYIGGSSTMEFTVDGDTLTTKIRQLTSANGISPEGAIDSTMTLRRVP